ncbi:carbohydrate-binding module family 20 domain-containing protein [Actinoplanes sp. DH11]|uniref:carbohydrate-binding module family 20 domain-containing protein n=1 Tax=Actinoplanes sp. DH11 TaxID=2857011 RepID=UPI001E635C14|nr:carbohydrate-binding module family 20 domain-containing protein [Actinoplanes sp. DH11]
MTAPGPPLWTEAARWPTDRKQELADLAVTVERDRHAYHEASCRRTAGFTAWGQSVQVVGSIPELGFWNTAKAVPLTTTAGTFPTWTGGVALPPNTYVEFQYVVKNANGTVARWEKGYQQNRATITPPTGTWITHDTFGGY